MLSGLISGGCPAGVAAEVGPDLLTTLTGEPHELREQAAQWAASRRPGGKSNASPARRSLKTALADPVYDAQWEKEDKAAHDKAWHDHLHRVARDPAYKGPSE